MRSIVAAATLFSLAQCHQNFHQFWINGVSPGYHVGIRMPPSNSPVTDVTSNDIVCNVNGMSGKNVAVVSAKAGDTVKVQWDSSTHPGPITHMLFGPVADATAATGVGQWAKIDELAYSGGKWANEIMEAQNMTYTFKLPANLASGDYLLRSEMEALHSSQTIDSTQFYIGCAQLRIIGPGGSCSPKITLPGAYKDTDTNIYISNFYYGFNPTTFTAPGGPVATCGGSGGGPAPAPTSSSAPTSTAVRSSSALRPTTTAVVSSSKGQTTLATSTLRSSIPNSTTKPATTSSGCSAGISKYGQCGGSGYTGSTTCTCGSTCSAINNYYSQCL